MDEEDFTQESYFINAPMSPKESTEYKKYMSRAIELGRRIMEILGPNRSLFLEYEQNSCLAKGIRLKSAYQLGKYDMINHAQQNAQQSIPTQSIND